MSEIQRQKQKKKVSWDTKDKLHLQLQLRTKRVSPPLASGKCYLSPNTTFSLRLPTKSSMVNNNNNGQGNNQGKNGKYIKTPLSASFKLIPTMGLANYNQPPVIIATTPTQINISVKNNFNNNNNNRENKDNKENNDGNKNVRNNCYKNDYTNNYIHSGKLPYKYIRNAKQQVEGYPKLQRLYKLKEQQVLKYATRPYGCKINSTQDLTSKLNSWVYDYELQFDVIMIGALTENQLIYPLLAQLPIDKLCSKPGFLFIWASTQKISELSTLMNDQRTWSKKFRRSEELVFIPVDKNSVYYPKEWSIPEDQLLEEVQWHCWMCITGTVRRSSDNDLIHCNVNTDLSLENNQTGNSAVPSQIYKVVENFSSSTKRLHIIPTSTGINKHVNVRPGWVIASPDIILDNFDPVRYKNDINAIGTNIPHHDEIEQLRPKTPV